LASVSSQQYVTCTHWGRVGSPGQSKTLGDGSLEDALRLFESKFKEKSGHKWDDRYNPPKAGKYTFIERDYEQSSSDEAENEDELPGAEGRRGSKQSNSSTKSVECTLPEPVQRLLEIIFNQQYFDQTLAELHYDNEKLPLGKLSKRTLNSGFGILKSIAEVIANPNKAMELHGVGHRQALENLTNRYYTTIPHVFGQRRPPLIETEQLVKREVDLLEALTDMEIADAIMKDTKLLDENGNSVHPLDRHYAGLGMQEMTPRKYLALQLRFSLLTLQILVKHDASEFKEIEKYLIKGKGITHGLAFKVSIPNTYYSHMLSFTRSKTSSASSEMANSTVSSSLNSPNSNPVTAVCFGMALALRTSAVS
jgi:poly [ADP-ribose] polymerase